MVELLMILPTVRELVAAEAGSALPNAPVQAEPARPRQRLRFATARALTRTASLTSSLADRVAPERDCFDGRSTQVSVTPP
jgi:hypothetical protein